MKNITFSADEKLIEAARERARAQHTTLNEAFRRWLEEYAQRQAQADEALHVVEALRGKLRTGGRTFTREEMSVSFIDSNVFIYLFDETNASKRGRAEALVQEGLETRSASISFQVVQEVLNTLVHKLGADPEDAAKFLRHLLVPLWRVMPSQALYERALDLQARYRFSFYDSLIVAAALEGGCSRLYSEDLQHSQRIQGLVIENPFL